jgi:nucleotide-binding universal stress UspA family protein
VLVASEGSPEGRAAVAAAVAFPWPVGTHAGAVLARGPVPAGLPNTASAALEDTFAKIAARSRIALAARWPDARVAIVSGPVPAAIVAEARRRRARVIVMGSVRHGALARFLMGSVSRAVARDAPCAVLLARGRLRRLDHVIVGVDGSAHSRRGVELVARLVPRRGSRATVVRVVESTRVPSLGFLPARVRSILGGQATALQAQQIRAARRDIETAVRRLRRAGWRAAGSVRVGAPADDLLGAARATGAALVVVGSRGAGGGVEHLLLGSVADAIAGRSPVSVLVAR